MSRRPSDTPANPGNGSKRIDAASARVPDSESAAGVNMHDSVYQEIAPIDLDFSALETDSAAGATELGAQAGRPGWILPTVGALLVLALAVIFLLPRVVPPPQATSDPNDDVASAAVETPAAESSPWQKAQMERERQAAQQALEPLLDKQFQLEELQVQRWGEQEFGNILELAEQGDQFYRTRKFSQATDSFQRALGIADTLLDSVDQRIVDALQQGNQAIADNDAQTARQAFDLVLAIRPDNEDANVGLARLSVLDEVHVALLAADALEEQGDLSAARTQLANALALDDARSDVLTPRMSNLADRIRDADYTRLMSEGYRNLDAGRRQAAIDSFNAAARLKPDETQPGVAIKQVRNEQALNAMAGHFDTAERSEAAENWAAAVEAYEAALTIDSKLGDASKRLAYARQRLKMDSALQTLSNDPLRLANAEIYQKALKIVTAGRAISAPGPRLRSQLGTLEQQLRASRESRPVTIHSDGFTQVSLPRIARLGTIQQHRLNLKPGRYAAVGIRDGYRDVRKEFVVPLDSNAVEVDIRCVEPI